MWISTDGKLPKDRKVLKLGLVCSRVADESHRTELYTEQYKMSTTFSAFWIRFHKNFYSKFDWCYDIFCFMCNIRNVCLQGKILYLALFRQIVFLRSRLRSPLWSDCFFSENHCRRGYRAVTQHFFNFHTWLKVWMRKMFFFSLGIQLVKKTTFLHYSCFLP